LTAGVEHAITVHRLALLALHADRSFSRDRDRLAPDRAPFRVLIAWLTAALRPVGPYPILSLHGEQESAKKKHAGATEAEIRETSGPARG
jgi:hypothetical protein